MSYIKPLADTELKKFSTLFKMVERNMGFVPNSMKTMAKEPAILGAFTSLSGLILGDPSKSSPMVLLKLMWNNLKWGAKFMKKSDRIPLELRFLVAHVSSNAAGCRYCQAHTIGLAANNGVSTDKLAAIWEYRTSDHFDDAERAALNFGLAAGSTPNAVTKEHFIELRKHYSEDQILELGAVVSIFGFLNRWNDTFATQLEEIPLKHGNTLLEKSGWEIGKHFSEQRLEE